MTLQAVQLCDIYLDRQDTQPRVSSDPAVIAEYAQLMRDGQWDWSREEDAIRLWQVGGQTIPTNGWQRIMAAADADLEEVQAMLFTGSKADAIWDSIGTNKFHGLRRSNADKERAVRMALEARPEMSDRAIAEYIGVGHPLVARVRASGSEFQIDSRTVTRNGTTYQQNTAGISAANAKRKSETTKALIDPETGEDITDRAVVQTTRPFAKQGPMGPTGNRIVNAAELNAMVDEDCGFDSAADHLAKATQLIRECAASWSPAKQRRTAAAVSTLAELVKHY